MIGRCVSLATEKDSTVVEKKAGNGVYKLLPLRRKKSFCFCGAVKQVANEEQCLIMIGTSTDIAPPTSYISRRGKNGIEKFQNRDRQHDFVFGFLGFFPPVDRNVITDATFKDFCLFVYIFHS